MFNYDYYQVTKKLLTVNLSIIFHLAMTTITTLKMYKSLPSRCFVDIIHNVLSFLWWFPGKIIVLCLITRNSPASLFNLKDTMIHTADYVSFIALAAGILRTKSLTHLSDEW